MVWNAAEKWLAKDIVDFDPKFESAMLCGEADPQMFWQAFMGATKPQLKRQLKNYRREAESLFPPTAERGTFEEQLPGRF